MPNVALGHAPLTIERRLVSNRDDRISTHLDTIHPDHPIHPSWHHVHVYRPSEAQQGHRLLLELLLRSSGLLEPVRSFWVSTKPLSTLRFLALTPSASEPSTAPFAEPVGINPAEKSKSINTPMHEYGQYLLTCLPKYIQQFSVYKDELTLYVAPSAILQTLTFLRDHAQCQYKQVMDITAVDYPTKPMRFEVSPRNQFLEGDLRVRSCTISCLSRISRGSG